MKIFKPILTKVTVSSPIRKNNLKQANIISKSSSSREYGRIISYKNGDIYGKYKQI